MVPVAAARLPVVCHRRISDDAGTVSMSLFVKQGRPEVGYTGASRHAGAPLISIISA
jgi:hypothetical protein